jgi:hypothetical protein
VGPERRPKASVALERRRRELVVRAGNSARDKGVSIKSLRIGAATTLMDAALRYAYNAKC